MAGFRRSRLRILWQGMTLALIGALIGPAIAFLATRLLKSILYGFDGMDPTTFIGVTFLLGTVALLACCVAGGVILIPDHDRDPNSGRERSRKDQEHDHEHE